MPELYDVNGTLIQNSPQEPSRLSISPVGTEALKLQTRAAAARKGLDPDFVTSIVNQESQFNPNAVNPKELSEGGHAKGLFQFTPSTAKKYNLDDPLNPQKSIEAGTNFLADLNKQYNGDKYKIAVHYNSGPANVDKPFEKLPAETQDYVTKVLGPDAVSTHGSQKEVYDLNGNPINVSKSPFAPSSTGITPQQKQAKEQQFQTYEGPGQTVREAAQYAPIVAGGAGGAIGSLIGMPAIGAALGSGLGEVVAGSAQHGVPTQEDLKNALEGAGISLVTEGLFRAPGLLKRSLQKNAVGKAQDLLESQRQEITGGVPSGSVEGKQLELEAKNAPIESEKNEAWKKVYDRTDQAQKTLDVLTGDIDPVTKQPITVKKTVGGPIKLSKDTIDFINQEKQRLETNIKAGVMNPRDMKTYQALDRLSKGLTTDKSGDAYTDFDSAKQLRTTIGKQTAQELNISVQAPGQRIGLQRGSGIQAELRNKLEGDISSSLYDIGGPDAINEYANAVGMTKKAAKANVFDKVLAKNTDQATGNLNVDSAMNDFLNSTSKDSRQFTYEERQNIRKTLLALKNTSGYGGGLSFQNGRIVFNSVLALGHPWRAAIAAKDLFERGMSDPKYARVLQQLPSAPAESSQSKMMTRSFFSGALKGVPTELVAPSGMRVKAHVDENGEPRPDFQMTQ